MVIGIYPSNIHLSENSKKMKAVVIIPAKNEAKTIKEVVTRALRHADVSVTDDGSTDETPQILSNIQREHATKKNAHQLHIITHHQSTHIPRAIQDGMRHAMDMGYDFAITMDAGLSHDPDAIPQFLSADNSLDLVIGIRAIKANIPAYRRLISMMGTRVVNYAVSKSWFDIMGMRISDCTSGFRRYSRRALEIVARASLKSKMFDFHMEALALCIRQGMTCGEIPITYIFSNSSFNLKVLRQAIKFGLHLLKTKST